MAVKSKPLVVQDFDSFTKKEKLEYLKNLYGVEETKDVLQFMVEVARGIKRSYADDGEITYKDVMNFLGAFSLLSGAIKGLGHVPTELLDEITEEERAEMLGVIVQSGVLPEQAGEVLEDALEILELTKRFIINHFISPAL